MSPDPEKKQPKDGTKATPFADFFGGILGRAVKETRESKIKREAQMGKKRPKITKPPSVENKTPKQEK